MSTEQSGGLMQTVSLHLLSAALDRSQALIRMVAKSLDVKITDGHVTLPDALALIRYFASQKGEQDALWEEQSSKLESAKAREFELAMALDIVKRERGSLEKQVALLTAQLDKAHERNDRLEAKLHELTASFAHLVSQRDRLVAQTKVKSKVSLKYHQGREVLYLEQPVNLHLLGRDHH
jgi:septal ring factor EnvC (AmiA/AmiB activator)